MKNIIKYLLEKEVKPATGCTEPVAIALATAVLAATLGTDRPDTLEVALSPNIYKNAMGVGIPNMPTRGLEYAAAAGLKCANSAGTGLQVLVDLKPEESREAEAYVAEGNVTVTVAEVPARIHIRAYGTYEGSNASVVIEGAHDKVVAVTLNGSPVDSAYLSQTENNDAAPGAEMDTTPFFNGKISDIVRTIETLSLDDIGFLHDGIRMNMAAAQQGMDSPLGLGIGYHVSKELGEINENEPLVSLASHAMMLTASASDARMSGLNVPVMTSNGSGNNGLTAILPLVAYAKSRTIDELSLVRAMAISHMVNCYIKNHIGKLAPVCSCAISAASGAGAAVAWLETKDMKVIEGTISNMIANLSGLICDGAKEGCALKLSTAAYTSIISVSLAKAGVVAGRGNGIISKSVEESIVNLGILSNSGMATMDQTLIQIMMSC